jgi:hypothetical protein
VTSSSVALQNLTSVSVLVFAVGFFAALVRSDLRLPDAVYQLISIYLLFGIGLKGGVALHHAIPGPAPVIATIALGIFVPTLVFHALRLVPALGRVDRGAIAAHYGSTSLVTFSATLVFLESAGIGYEGYATTLLTIMEIPGILVGILLASRGLGRHVAWGESAREVLLGKTVVLLLGGLVIGAISGDAGYLKVQPFFVDLQPGMLALFLMHLGFVAGSQLHALREAGTRLFALALAFPLVTGSLGVAVATAIGMSEGGATVLGILCASASYIAAPAAVGIALPEANRGLPITMSIGVTFPFNLLFGIPLLHALAHAISG